ncbi:hypothetical protein Tco_0335186 [Tanacetum coccineum]
MGICCCDDKHRDAMSWRTISGDAKSWNWNSHLADTDIESGPLKDLRETEISQTLLVVPSPIPSSDDLHLTIGQAYTPATVDTESEPEEAPSETEYRSSYETPSSLSSLTLPIWKRYQGTSELVEDTEEESLNSDDKRDRSEDEVPSSEEGEEEAALEGQQQVVPTKDTAMDKPLGLGYGALRHHELVVGEATCLVDPEDGRVYTDILTYVPPVAPVQTPPSLEWSSGSLLVSPSSPAVPTLVASPVATLVATIAVDGDEFLEVGAQLELHGSILHDHIQCLDALPLIGWFHTVNIYNI